MRTQLLLVVVEVRYRESPGWSPALTVDRGKQRRIIQSTQHFMQRHREFRSYALRFDVVVLSGPLDRVKLRWWPAAFNAGDGQIESTC